MGILSWIIFGLIAGILAKWIMPGKDGGGFIVTVILGVIGAVVGGWISTLFGFGKVDGFNFGSFVVAVIGALGVLFVYRKIHSEYDKRPPSGGLLLVSPPAQLATCNGNDGHNQHNNGRFSHLSPWGCVTANKKPR
jgi:uncharacterized membrane protein YeaQ/YmgE (transglycosylase-associated protein family)